MTNALFFTFRTQRDARTYTKLEWLFYRIFLFTFRAQCDARTYAKLEWLFYRIGLFTLRAQRDARTYTSTTDQCGARSGSPQILSKLDSTCSILDTCMNSLHDIKGPNTWHTSEQATLFN